MINTLDQAKESYYIITGKDVKTKNPYYRVNKRVVVSFDGFKLIMKSNTHRSRNCHIINTNLLDIVNMSDPDIAFYGDVAKSSRCDTQQRIDNSLISKDELRVIYFEFFRNLNNLIATIRREYNILATRCF